MVFEKAQKKSRKGAQELQVGLELMIVGSPTPGWVSVIIESHHPVCDGKMYNF